MKILFLLIAVLFSARAQAIKCYGDPRATQAIVYLHGRDTKLPNVLEKSNREVLKKIANELHVRIALPRAKNFCKGNPKKLCWLPEETVIASGAALTRAMQLSKACFSHPVKPILLGFSNGGYLSNRVLRFCLRTDFSAILSVGAGGGSLDTDPQDLKNCEKVHVLVSTTEASKEDAETFVERMKQKGGQIELSYFTGQHSVPMEETKEILEKLLVTGNN